VPSVASALWAMKNKSRTGAGTLNRR
jgi:hypothetical protein